MILLTNRDKARRKKDKKKYKQQELKEQKSLSEKKEEIEGIEEIEEIEKTEEIEETGTMITETMTTKDLIKDSRIDFRTDSKIRQINQGNNLMDLHCQSKDLLQMCQLRIFLQELSNLETFKGKESP